MAYFFLLNQFYETLWNLNGSEEHNLKTTEKSRLYLPRDSCITIIKICHQSVTHQGKGILKSFPMKNFSPECRENTVRTTGL